MITLKFVICGIIQLLLITDTFILCPIIYINVNKLIKPWLHCDIIWVFTSNLIENHIKSEIIVAKKTLLKHPFNLDSDLYFSSSFKRANNKNKLD